MSSKTPLVFFARVDLRRGFAVASDSSSSSTVGVSSFAFRFDLLALGFVTSTTSLPLGSSVSATEDVALDLVAAVLRVGARAGVFVALAARERVLLPRLSSWSSESGSGSTTLVERVRVVFWVCKDALEVVLRIAFFLSGSSVILGVKKGHSVPRFATLRRCSSLVTLGRMQ